VTHRVRIGRRVADRLVLQSMDGHGGGFDGSTFRDVTGWAIEFVGSLRFVVGDSEALTVCAMHVAGLQDVSPTGYIPWLAAAEEVLLEAAAGIGSAGGGGVGSSSSS
jgi:hypothetical protein